MGIARLDVYYVSDGEITQNIYKWVDLTRRPIIRPQASFDVLMRPSLGPKTFHWNSSGGKGKKGTRRGKPGDAGRAT